MLADCRIDSVAAPGCDPWPLWNLALQFCNSALRTLEQQLRSLWQISAWLLSRSGSAWFLVSEQLIFESDNYYLNMIGYDMNLFSSAEKSLYLLLALMASDRCWMLEASHQLSGKQLWWQNSDASGCIFWSMALFFEMSWKFLFFEMYLKCLVKKLLIVSAWFLVHVGSWILMLFRQVSERFGMDSACCRCGFW